MQRSAMSDMLTMTHDGQQQSLSHLAMERPDDESASIIRLQLKRPTCWRWELTTARSAVNVALPRVQLYDHEGHLLVDAATQAECIYRPALDATEGAAATLATPNITSTQSASRTSNSLISVVEETSRHGTPTSTNASGRTNSSKEVRFLLDERERDDERAEHADEVSLLNGAHLPTPPSTETTTTTTPTTTTSSSLRRSGRWRRRRSVSALGHSLADTRSILERFSLIRGSSSSAESDDEDASPRPRYFLRTSKAGTLVLKENSFRRGRRRRKLRHSSTESNSHNKAEAAFRRLTLATPPTSENETSQRRESQPTGKYVGRANGTDMPASETSTSDGRHRLCNSTRNRTKLGAKTMTIVEPCIR